MRMLEWHRILAKTPTRTNSVRLVDFISKDCKKTCKDYKRLWYFGENIPGLTRRKYYVDLVLSGYLGQKLIMNRAFGSGN